MTLGMASLGVELLTLTLTAISSLILAVKFSMKCGCMSLNCQMRANPKNAESKTEIIATTAELDSV